MTEHPSLERLDVFWRWVHAARPSYAKAYTDLLKADDFCWNWFVKAAGQAASIAGVGVSKCWESPANRRAIEKAMRAWVRTAYELRYDVECAPKLEVVE